MEPIKDKWKANRDTILLVVLVAGIAGAIFEGGRFLVTLLKWPIIVALAAGIVFGFGNDGYHAAKRFIRDKAIPWLRERISWPF